MRILFTVQGQGRGHMTQAIAAWEVLTEAGHEVVGVVAGAHPGRPLPSFFVDAFDVPVTEIPSPGFVFKRNRGVDIVGTLMHGVRHLPEWITGFRTLTAVVAETRPDVVLNFFEPLTGAMQALRRSDVPVLAAAHQFILLGPRWGAVPGQPVAPLWLRAFIRFVGCRSSKLALSFVQGADARPAPDRIVVSPPLLRRQVLRLEPDAGDYYLVYMATHGYAELVRAWHVRNPDVKLHCFYDRPGAPRTEEVGPNLTFHQLDAVLFLELMAGCKAVMCTAGFESICEAAYLGKPVLMVPLDDHHEQQLNAIDGELSGVAVGHPTFDLDALASLPTEVDLGWFRAWCAGADTSLVRTLEEVAGVRGPRSEAETWMGDTIS